ncbi:MAG: hypothetical protein GWO07_08800 [Candidatus Dadabacteria bacterium]|nr:hypothetical protein [Candidatus Dadabacteria bacterium]NIS08844.1 hypothetical protein [Candidatus Dadabacteria bacterium]NIV42794.1 hypothetical protein [Candidatus Dadabacteria bacterium]NIX16107.1 hypothetical protein [Candidatus Dadabacteria bacterium]NIY22194.1 hypothetical protein [Candidatus Dadabacteria bacterium]
MSPETITQTSFIEGEINKYSAEQQNRISLKLRELDVDWSKTDKIKKGGQFSVAVNKSKTRVMAGEKIDISVTVKNTGADPTEQLYAITKSDNPVFNDKEYVFGKIPAGGVKSWTNSFEVPKWALSRDDKIELIFKDNNKELINHSLNVQTVQLQRPRFAFNYEIIDDGRFDTKGNGNSIAETGELIGLKLKLKNTGNGQSEKSTLLLKNNLGEDLYLKKGRIKLENIKPNEVREEVFLFSVNNPIKVLDLEFQIIDDIFREGITKKINLRIPESLANNITKKSKYLVNSDSVPVYGSPFESSSIVAYASKNSVFESEQSNSMWAKVSLDSSSSGWINKKFLAVPQQTNTAEASGIYTPFYQQSPYIALEKMPLLLNEKEISLRGTIKDSDGVKLITVYLGEDKVFLKNFYTDSAALNTKISLKSGVNYINIFAKDKLGLVSKKTYIVRYDA